MFFRKFADQSGELNKKHINTKNYQLETAGPNKYNRQ